MRLLNELVAGLVLLGLLLVLRPRGRAAIYPNDYPTH